MTPFHSRYTMVVEDWVIRALRHDMSNSFVNYYVLCTFLDCRDQFHESPAEANNLCLASYFKNSLVDRQSSEVSVAGSTCISALKRTWKQSFDGVLVRRITRSGGFYEPAGWENDSALSLRWCNKKQHMCFLSRAVWSPWFWFTSLTCEIYFLNVCFTVLSLAFYAMFPVSFFSLIELLNCRLMCLNAGSDVCLERMAPGLDSATFLHWLSNSAVCVVLNNVIWNTRHIPNLLWTYASYHEKKKILNWIWNRWEMGKVHDLKCLLVALLRGFLIEIPRTLCHW